MSKRKNLTANKGCRRRGFTSPNAEEDVADGFLADAFLDLLEQQSLVETLKFLQPDGMIDCDDEDAVAQADGLGVVRDIGANDLLPKVKHLRLL
jgi:hypothetical protein